MNPPPSHDDSDLSQNSDYKAPQNDLELQKIHESIVREKMEPKEGREPLPLWLMALFCLLLFGGGLYLGTHSGGFRSDVFDLSPTDSQLNNGKQFKPADSFVAGRRLFIANCSSCHQINGQGVPNTYPPLAGSEIVLGQKGWGDNHLIKIVLNGLSGPITVKGNKYDGSMPMHKEMLKDGQIVLILNYVRQEWGNSAAEIPVEAIAELRKASESRQEPWTEAELRMIPPQQLPMKPAAPLPGSEK